MINWKIRMKQNHLGSDIVSYLLFAQNIAKAYWV